ncbi:MAG: hypothetical protein ACI97N_000572 [Cognaticolwellia sp.]|jgi:hypothetical protein
MKRTFWVLLLSMIANITFGQVNDWVNNLDVVNGKDKVILLNKIAEFYTNESDGFTAKNYAKQAIDLSESMEYMDGLAVGYFLLAEAYNLEDDLKSAKKSYKNWYKTRKKHGSKSQLKWATKGMGMFYQSQEKDWRTERYYKKLLKKSKAGSRTEFGVFRVLAEYYQYGANFRTDRTLNLKKGTKYFELLTISGQKVFGADFGTNDLDHYFSSELSKYLKKKDIKTSNKIAQRWLKSKAKFSDDLELYKTSRLIVRLFYFNESYADLPVYLNKSIAYGSRISDEDYLKNAYLNAIYLTRSSKNYEIAIQYCFDFYGKTNPNHITSALNTCVTELLKENDTNLNQKVNALIWAWQKGLNTEKDKAAYNCAANNLLLLK